MFVVFHEKCRVYQRSLNIEVDVQIKSTTIAVLTVNLYKYLLH